MALILAIESDRRQVSHLTAMVRGRLRAELVLGDTAEAALERLGNRVPDLILTSPLLSPRDEQALTDRLRRLNGVASHVQTLTLPVFALPNSGTAPPRGVLSALLGDRQDSSTDGCDPAVFAEQCREYLDRVAAERKAQQRDAPDIDAPVPAEPPSATPSAAESPLAPEYEFAAEPAEAATPASTPTRSLHITDDPSSIIAAFAAEPEPPADDDPFGLVTGDPEIEEVPEEESTETDTSFVDVDLSELVEERAPIKTASQENGSEELDEVPVYDLAAPGADVDEHVPTAVAAPIAAASTAAGPPPDDFADWEAVVDALKRESKRVNLPRRKQRPPARPVAPAVPLAATPLVAPSRATPPSAAATSAATVTAKPVATTPAAPAARRAKRIQDEWGMFDPQEAGMAALFAKLEQLNNDDDPGSTPQT